VASIEQQTTWPGAVTQCAGVEDASLHRGSNPRPIGSCGRALHSWPQRGWISDIATAITENAKIIHFPDEVTYYYHNELIFQSASRAGLRGDRALSTGVEVHADHLGSGLRFRRLVEHCGNDFQSFVNGPADIAFPVKVQRAKCRIRLLCPISPDA
jgi:hypothetical protein